MSVSFNNTNLPDPTKIVQKWDAQANSSANDPSADNPISPQLIAKVSIVSDTHLGIDRKAAKEAKKNEKASRVAKNKNKGMAPVSPAQPDLGKDAKLRTVDEISVVRFSQDSVAPLSGDGVDLFEVIRTKGWKKGVALDLVSMPDDLTTSLTNRRLLAAKRITHEVSHSFFHDGNAIEAIIVKHDDMHNRLPKDIKNIQSQYKKRLVTYPTAAEAHLNIKDATYGAMVYYRMRCGSGDVENEPYGFTANPKVRDS
jgi:hypothetical protein